MSTVSKWHESRPPSQADQMSSTATVMWCKGPNVCLHFHKLKKKKSTTEHMGHASERVFGGKIKSQCAQKIGPPMSAGNRVTLQVTDRLQPDAQMSVIGVHWPSCRTCPPSALSWPTRRGLALLRDEEMDSEASDLPTFQPGGLWLQDLCSSVGSPMPRVGFRLSPLLRTSRLFHSSTGQTKPWPALPVVSFYAEGGFPALTCQPLSLISMRSDASHGVPSSLDKGDS